MSSSERQQLAEQACQLAALRGVRCYALIAEKHKLPSSPAQLVEELPAPRHVLWRGTQWMVAQGAAASLRVSGPGRATRLSAAFATLRERCLCAGAFPRSLPLATLAFAFEAEAPGSGAWGENLPGAEAILPARVWWREGRNGYLLRTVAVEPSHRSEDVIRAWDALDRDHAPSESLPSPAPAWNVAEHGNFKELVEDAVALVHHGALRKVVLARAVDRQLTKVPKAQTLLERLRDQADPDTTVYWYDLPGGTSFIGATPETLFRIEQGKLSTMALAGSRPRGSNARLDRQLAKELMSSTKERKEHNLVLEHICRVLERRVDIAHIPESPSLRKLGSVQHLQTDLSATLTATDPFDLLAQLHPTPAVCGLPTALAADHIRRKEKLHRGLYSGVLGWMTPDDCHTIVPLRGGLINQQRVRLFAGAGIVETSDPEAEERETEAKLRLMQKVLNLEDEKSP